MNSKAGKQNKELEQIFANIYKKYDVGSDPILEHNLHPFLVKLRRMVWHYLYYHKHWSAKDIARVFDRAESTIHRGIKNSPMDYKIIFKK
jgi:hypothetical protein